MNEIIAEVAEKPRTRATKGARPAPGGKAAVTLSGHIVEIVSDSGEGAQRCGQTFGAIASQMGNGVWTVEIIPAEIRPPARSVAGGSGNRIRLGSGRVTNGGNETDLVIAFNEQVLLGRVRTGELKPDCTILLESMWRESRDPKIVESYIETYDQLVKAGYKVIEIPMERECKTIVADGACVGVDRPALEAELLAEARAAWAKAPPDDAIARDLKKHIRHYYGCGCHIGEPFRAE